MAISCDRCQKKILPEEFQTVPSGYESVYLVACLPCQNEFARGIDKIRDELARERTKRIENWCKEWLRNYEMKK